MAPRKPRARLCGYPCACPVDPAHPTRLRSVSYGAGKQSTGLLVLAAQQRIDFDLFLMSNVGDDSEHPDSLAYARHIAKPYAEAHGIELQILERQRRDGTTETLMERLLNPVPHRACKGEGCDDCQGTGKVESRSLPIPVRMSNGAPGTRSCTADFKIKVISRWLKAHGATADNPATIGIGISLDEIQRAANRKQAAHERVVYPLVGIGEETGLKLRRDDCERIIGEEPLPDEVVDHLHDVGLDVLPAKIRRQLETRPDRLPVPSKSSCYFCPFHRPAAWADLAQERPDLFEKSVKLEETLNVRRERLGKDPVFLTRFGIPLREAVDTDQVTLFDDADGSCDTGYCFT